MDKWTLNKIVMDRISSNRILLLELGALVNNLDDDHSLGLHVDGDHIIYESLQDIADAITLNIDSNRDEEDSI